MTDTTTIQKGKWTLLSEASIRFQILSGSTVYAIEAASAPADGETDIRKELNPGELYSFIKENGGLYLYAANAGAEVTAEVIL